MKGKGFQVRSEQVVFELELEAAGLSAYARKKINLFARYATKLRKGDKCHITYDFDITYFGPIIERLEALLYLCDRARIKTVNTKELKHGRCLIQELVCKLERSERKFQER